MVSSITKAIPYNTSMGNVLQDCIDVLRSISYSSLEFVKQLANQATHLLAKAARSGPWGLVFYLFIPSFPDNALHSNLIDGN